MISNFTRNKTFKIIITIILFTFAVFATSCKEDGIEEEVAEEEEVSTGEENSDENEIVIDSSETQKETPPVVEEEPQKPIEWKGITINPIEGLRFDDGSFYTIDNRYNLLPNTEAGKFIKDAFEFNGKMENSIGLRPEVIEVLQQKYLEENKELKFPIPFNLTEDINLKMQILENQFQIYDEEKKKELEKLLWDKKTFLAININEGSIIYSPLKTTIIDENNGGFSFSHYILTEEIKSQKDVYESTLGSSFDIPDNIINKIFYNKTEKVNTASLDLYVQGAKPIIIPETTKEYGDSGDIRNICETDIGTPLFVINNEPNPELDWYFQWGNLDSGSFSINIIYHIAQVDYEKHVYKKYLQTGDNIFLEKDKIKLSFYLPN